MWFVAVKAAAERLGPKFRLLRLSKHLPRFVFKDSRTMMEAKAFAFVRICALLVLLHMVRAGWIDPQVSSPRSEKCHKRTQQTPEWARATLSLETSQQHQIIFSDE